ncbi:MAG: A/G-specific adenine glycosylase [Chloroflexi bacterium]|nr:A/G-specific adenine glycosylase [Chloroflexota bacterium]
MACVDVRAVQRDLLAWYAAHGRDLPWRRTRDPYHILLAEVMLQQTQVERALPKYREFLQAFPTVADLAGAPRAEVIRRWSPLGYNLRAVRLHRIAQQAAQERACRFPESLEELLSLKGVGRYTAGAIACFAFGQPVAFLDTNIRRVLGRCLGSIPYPAASQDRALLALAEEALPREQAYAWHQGLMDLGAAVCLRARPRCGECPLAAHCRARPLLEAEEGEGVGRSVREERPPYRVQPRYPGSRRYYRGRIVAALRVLPSGESLSLETLGRRLRPEFTAEHTEDAKWLRALVAGLAREGLVAVDSSEERGGPTISLPREPVRISS